MLSVTWAFLLLAYQSIQQAHGKAVFAHFMLTNSENYTSSDWETDMTLAKNSHIDAFALNMARRDPTNYHSLEMAFVAANTVGFKLFFSFDYAGNGPWDQDEVTALIQKYGSNGAYFQHNAQPFVSTFEGPSNADDWIGIKQKTNCFLVPDWSSVGAKPAMALANGVADGLFSWSAWPWGNQTMDTYTDASYIQYLEGKPYMFAVSPWFYTALPGYDKNWLWKGDSLWVDRWQELLALNPMPEFVQIISWNDYGESHYIGPVYDKALASLTIGRAPYDYITNMPHDGWRDILPFFIDMYKTGKGTIKTETAVFWYRPNIVSGCSRSSTTANTASQLQLEFDPADVVEDRVYVAALFGDEVATVQVSFLKKSYLVSWDIIPDEKIGSGIYFGSVPFQPGPVTVEILQSDSSIARAKGMDISEGCRDGYQNFNAYVGSLSGNYDLNEQTKVPLKEQECVKGKGAYEFNDLCNFTCSYGYCPVGACTCEAMGVPRTKPNATGVTGYPAEGRDANYVGLCSFACNYGHCPTATCDTEKHPMSIPTVSDFLPPACVAGTGKSKAEGLCSFSCAYGYCPRNLCSCTKIGPLVEPPKKTSSGGMAQLGLDGVIDDLCDFTCSREYCPATACRSKEDVEASQVTAHWIEAPGAQCSEEKKQYILEELHYAKEMAETTSDHLQQGEYFTTFFPKALTNDPNFANGIAETYSRMADLIGGGLKDNFFRISCDQSTDGCKDKQWLAHMNDGTKIMNFCDSFFTETS
ncbi:glycosyl hydrolase family 71-domain-containing protein [Aspergillus pseudocaelatus]|uniref:Glycosyl hydrolase family 71-domain-containing protein n=1 Tax=Aspergillus pseudocaelatus TaxID=1825620 RepID=A0ABQ6WHX0_9EURO|nr:glycosyl hydrolase family 71-domain-containing protein [Aspergillus pseudocaelatus]